jgi:hypothetical protein
LAGKKQAEGLPASLARELAPLVEQGRELREAVMEVLAINLQLVKLWRAEQRSSGKRPRRRSSGRR